MIPGSIADAVNTRRKPLQPEARFWSSLVIAAAIKAPTTPEIKATNQFMRAG